MSEELLEQEKKLSAEISKLMDLLGKKDSLDFDFDKFEGLGRLRLDTLEDDKEEDEEEDEGEEEEEEEKDFFDELVDGKHLRKKKKKKKIAKINVLEMVKRIKNRPKLVEGSDSMTWEKLRKKEIQLSSLTTEEKRSVIKFGTEIRRRNQHHKAVKWVKAKLEGKMKENLERRKQLKEVVRQLREDQDVDLVFLVDCTESMQHVINVVMNNVTRITTYFENVFARVTLRVGFVGYRDATDFVQFIMCPLTTPELAKKWIESKNHEKGGQLAYGGGSTPEDIHGAISYVLKYVKWEKPTKVLVHIGDSPTHGSLYHDEGSVFSDPFPRGMFRYGRDDENMEDEKKELYTNTLADLFSEMNRRGIFYNFGQVPFLDLGNIITHTMVEKFRSYYDTEERKMEVFDFTSEYRMKISRSVRIAVQKKQKESIDIFLKSKLERKDVIEFKVREDRKWNETQTVKCCYITNEEEVSCESIEKYKPKYGKCVRRMRIQNHPFAKGGVRYAFLMEDMDENRKYVGKRIMEKERPKDGERYTKEIMTQILAKQFAREFNKEMEKLKLKGGLEFVTPQVVKMKINEHENLFVGIEPFISGGKLKFEKYNGNFGYVMPEELGVHEVPQAFSHYTFQKSKFILLVCDIQGVKVDEEKDRYLLTDPAINSQYDLLNNQDFEPNFGVDGYNEFFMTHRCGPICKALGLQFPRKNRKK